MGHPGVGKAPAQVLGQFIPHAQQQGLRQGRVFAIQAFQQRRAPASQAIEKGAHAPARMINHRQPLAAADAGGRPLLQKIQPEISAVGVHLALGRIQLPGKAHPLALPGQERIRIGHERPIHPSQHRFSAFALQPHLLQIAVGPAVFPQRHFLGSHALDLVICAQGRQRGMGPDSGIAHSRKQRAAQHGGRPPPSGPGQQPQQRQPQQKADGRSWRPAGQKNARSNSQPIAQGQRGQRPLMMERAHAHFYREITMPGATA